MCKFRDLTADEIEVRIGQATEKGVSLLLYKDARVDMAMLDSIGTLNWQREHYEVKGNLYCRVGINRNHDKPELPPEWIWKSDCGTESQAEAEKGESSDSFKRACVNWGIGRELYTAPFIWVSADKCKIVPKGQKFACYDDFSVQSIEIKDKRITALEIVNSKTKAVVFTFGMALTAPKKPEAPEPKPAQEPTLDQWREWAKGYIVSEGALSGRTLMAIYKSDHAAFAELKQTTSDANCIKAIKILEDWVAEFRAS